MSFKEFENWCNDRACDGCWGLLTATVCIEILDDIKKMPFWRRKEGWMKIENKVIKEIVEPIERKMKELNDQTL